MLTHAVSDGTSRTSIHKNIAGQIAESNNYLDTSRSEAQQMNQFQTSSIRTTKN